MSSWIEAFPMESTEVDRCLCENKITNYGSQKSHFGQGKVIYELSHSYLCEIFDINHVLTSIYHL